MIFQFDNSEAEFNQWTEPLSDNLTRVDAENFANLLRDDFIAVFLSSGSSIPLDYRLEIDMIRWTAIMEK